MLIKSPSIYLQKPDLTEICGPYLRPYGSHFLLILDETVKDKYKGGLFSTCASQSIRLTPFVRSACTHASIREAVNKALGSGIDGILGFGASGALNLAKAVGFYTNLPVILIPSRYTFHTCVSSKAAVTADGTAANGNVLFLALSQSPAMVLADTGILAESPLRALRRSMAQALSVDPDVRAGADAIQFNLVPGDFCSLTALAFARQSSDTIAEYGAEALKSLQTHTCTQALERVTEAVLYLGSMAEENKNPGVIASLHKGFSSVPECRPYASLCHAIGILLLMVLQHEPDEEIQKKRTFLKDQLGLPVRVTDLVKDVPLDSFLVPLSQTVSEACETNSCMLFSMDWKTIAGAFLYLEDQ